MKKHKLQAENLKVQSFPAVAEAAESHGFVPIGGCVCDMPPCGCTGAPDCTQQA